MNLNLDGKVALVTGSYRGTGAGIAERLGAEGAHVIVHGFLEDETQFVFEQLANKEINGRKILALPRLPECIKVQTLSELA